MKIKVSVQQRNNQQTVHRMEERLSQLHSTLRQGPDIQNLPRNETLMPIKTANRSRQI